MKIKKEISASILIQQEKPDFINGKYSIYFGK